MGHLGYEYFKEDPYLWMRLAKRDDGSEYYEYILLYIYDCLCMSEHPLQYFLLKPDSVGPPKMYLGKKISQVQLPTGVNAWTISASQYIQDYVQNIEKYLERNSMALRKGTNAYPYQKKHRPEWPELFLEEASYHASLIGVLRWMVDMG